MMMKYLMKQNIQWNLNILNHIVIHVKENEQLKFQIPHVIFIQI